MKEKIKVDSELDNAWKHLTQRQMQDIDRLKGESISGIACKLGLTRSFVHSYIRKLNRGE